MLSETVIEIGNSIAASDLNHQTVVASWELEVGSPCSQWTSYDGQFAQIQDIVFLMSRARIETCTTGQ